MADMDDEASSASNRPPRSAVVWPPLPTRRSAGHPGKTLGGERGARTWTVRLTAAARADFEQILRWTVDPFGEVQAPLCRNSVGGAE